MISKATLDDIVNVLKCWCDGDEYTQRDVYVLLQRLEDVKGNKSFSETMKAVRHAFKMQCDTL